MKNSFLPSERALAPSPQIEAAFAALPIGVSLLNVMQDGTKSNREVAEYLLRNPVRVVGWGIQELARQTGTSPATLSRFARALQFDGFAALRAAMAEAVQETLQPAYRPVEKLRHAMGRRSGQNNAQSAVLLESMDATLNNVRHTSGALDVDALKDIAQQILKARTVYTMGFSLSSHLAAILELHLQPYCRHLVNVVQFGGTSVAAGRLMNVGKGDVVISISFPRYSKNSIALTQNARAQGAYVIAITDSAASPIAPMAHTALIASSVHPVLASSHVAGLLVVETVVASLMVSRPGHVKQAGKLTGAISNYLYGG